MWLWDFFRDKLCENRIFELLAQLGMHCAGKNSLQGWLLVKNCITLYVGLYRWLQGNIDFGAKSGEISTFSSKVNA